MNPLEKKDKINIISLIVLAGIIVAVTYHHVCSTVFHLGYPYDTFFFTPKDRYMDFFKIYPKFAAPDILSASFGVSAYFPMMLGIEYIFALLTPRFSFALFIGIFTAFFLWYNARHLVIRGERLESLKNVLVIALLSYPFLMALDRSNFEVVVFMLLALFLICYLSDRTVLGVALLAVCISTKLFPALMLLLYLKKGQYRATAATAALVAALVVVPLYFTEFITPAKLGEALSVYQQGYIVSTPTRAPGLGFGHSIFGMIRIFFQYYFPPLFFDHAAAMLRGYTAFSLLWAGVVSLYILVIEKTVWKQVALIVLCFTLLPYVSADYKLLHLYLPMLLFVNSEERTRLDPLYAVLFGLLLIPKSYFIFPGIHTDSGQVDISISIILNPLLMILLTGAIIREGWRAGGPQAIREARTKLAAFGKHRG